MHRKSHILFAISLSPLFFYPKNIYEELEKTNNDINNVFINNTIAWITKVFSFNIHIIEECKYIGVFLLGFILYLIGSVVPDIDFKLKIFYPKHMRPKTFYYHRQYTHSIFLWLFILFYFSFLYFKTNNIVYWLIICFSAGGITHLIGDMLTGTVPWLLYGHYGKWYTRIGITTIFPNTKKKSDNSNQKSFLNYFFTRKLPSFLESKCGYFIFILLFIFNFYISLF